MGQPRRFLVTGSQGQHQRQRQKQRRECPFHTCGFSAVPAGLGSPLSAYPGLTPWAAFCRRFAAGFGGALRGAGAPLFHGGFGFAAPFGALRLLRAGLRTERRALPGLSLSCSGKSQRQHPTPKADAAVVRGSHPCAKNAQGWGSLGVFGTGGQGQNQSQTQHHRERTEVSVLHMRLFCRPLRLRSGQALTGLGSSFLFLPRACPPSASSGQALGCILSPLCGWGLVGPYAALKRRSSTVVSALRHA